MIWNTREDGARALERLSASGAEITDGDRRPGQSWTARAPRSSTSLRSSPPALTRSWPVFR